MTPNLGYSKSQNKTSPKACSSQALPSPIAYPCFLNKFYLIFQSTELRKVATKSCITSAKAAPGFVPAKAQFSLLFCSHRSFEQTEVLPFLSSMADCVQFRPNQRYLKSSSCQQAVYSWSPPIGLLLRTPASLVSSAGVLDLQLLHERVERLKNCYPYLILQLAVTNRFKSLSLIQPLLNVVLTQLRATSLK